MSEVPRGPVIGFIFFLFLGIAIGLPTGIAIGDRLTTGRFNSILADGRARITDLERRNAEITELTDRLAGRLDQAASIVEGISRSGGTALEKVREVIGNLTKLKEILRSK